MLKLRKYKIVKITILAIILYSISFIFSSSRSSINNREFLAHVNDKNILIPKESTQQYDVTTTTITVTSSSTEVVTTTSSTKTTRPLVNEEFTRYDSIKSNGELGNGLIINEKELNAQQKKDFDEGWDLYSFSSYVSDRIPINRTLPDVRLPRYL